MNILSLFDGISCAQLALERAGITVNNYYASEIDKYAIKVTQSNYPNTVQLGDITKWKDWEIDIHKIDIIFAGFPCQAWSMAGKQKGDNDPRGALVHDLIAIWEEVKKYNPNVKFLFENVKMKKEFLVYINNLFGVEPILINSLLVSAQNRKRYYWTNINNVTQPEDMHIYLKNIIENGFVDRDKSYCVDANYYKGGNLEQYFKKSRRQLIFKDFMKLQGIKSFISEGGNIVDLTLQTIKTRANKYRICHTKGLDDKSRCLTTGTKMTNAGGTAIYINGIHRSLTPTECCRLQTLPDDYFVKSGISNSQIYRACGNGWTIDVIAHILKGLK